MMAVEVAKDYIVQVRIRNAPFRRAMRAAGFKTATELSSVCGVSQAVIGHFYHLKQTPYNKKTGEIVPSIVKIAAALNCHPDDLFPEQHRQTPLSRASVETEFNLQDIAALTAETSSLDTVEERLLIETAMRGLTARERKVLNCRFGLGGEGEMTLQETGKEFGVVPERVRQIEMRAIRKMRHPSSQLSERHNGRL